MDNNFKWRNDRAPKSNDTTSGWYVAIPANNPTGYNLRLWEDRSFKEGMPWARLEDVKQFTKDNPAPAYV